MHWYLLFNYPRLWLRCMLARLIVCVTGRPEEYRHHLWFAGHGYEVVVRRTA